MDRVAQKYSGRMQTTVFHMTEAAALKDAAFHDLAIAAACAKQKHYKQKKKESTP